MSKFDIKKILQNLRGIIMITIISFIFISFVEINLEEESKTNILEVNKQVAEKVSVRIDSNKEKLDFINAYINNIKNKSKNYYNENAVLDSLNIKNNQGLFKEIGISDKNGKLNFGNEIVDISDRKYFKESLKGNYYVSDPIKSRYSKDKVIAYSRPLEINGNIEGVLIGYSEYDFVEDMLVSDVYGEKSVVNILDANGNIKIGNSKNLGNQFKLNESTKNLTKLSKHHGIINIKMDGKEEYFAYEKLKGSQDLYICSITPSKDVFKNANNVISLSKITIVLIMILYVSNDVKKYKLNKIKLEKASYIDFLTKIRNKVKFKIDFQMIDKEKFKINKMIMIIFDIYGFKSINENHGYEEGDSILKQVAKKIESTKNVNIGARLSNDIFGVVIESEKEEDINTIISEFKHNIEDGIKTPNKLGVEISVGAYVVDDDVSFEKAIDNANIARKECKENNTLSYYVYNEELENKKSKENTIKRDLAEGLEKGEFRVVYQPKVDINSKEIVGAEALIRWIHSEKGFISPAEFIPIAEKNGDINLIGKWVLDRVCKDIKLSKEKGENIVPISINLSKIELYQEDLVECIEDIIKKYDIDSSLLEVEITETTALDDVDYINDVIHKIKDLGIKVSMDDFGTGSSTLSNIKLIDIDVLKIDRSMLLDLENDPKSRTLVENIIKIAKEFGFKVVCEGVENMDQVNILKYFDCDIIQGFVFSKPLELIDFKEKLKHGLDV